LIRDYLIIKYVDTHFGFIKYSNIFNFYYDLIRDHVTTRHADKNFKITRIPDMRTRVLGYGYDYVIKVIAKVLI